jgi:ADP-heptose:LPS heptosyltransferase
MKIEKNYVFGERNGIAYDNFYPRRLGDLINTLSYDLYNLSNNYRYGHDPRHKIGHNLKNELTFCLNSWDNVRNLIILNDFFEVPETISVFASALSIHKRDNDELVVVEEEQCDRTQPYGTIFKQIYNLPKVHLLKEGEGALSDEIFYHIDHPYMYPKYTYEPKEGRKNVLIHLYEDHYEDHKIIDSEDFDKLVTYFNARNWDICYSNNIQNTTYVKLHKQENNFKNVLYDLRQSYEGLEFPMYDSFMVNDPNHPETNMLNQRLLTQMKNADFVVSSVGGISHLARLFKIPQLVWYEKEFQPDHEKNINWNGDLYQHIDKRSINTTDYLQAKIDHVLNG